MAQLKTGNAYFVARCVEINLRAKRLSWLATEQIVSEQDGGDYQNAPSCLVESIDFLANRVTKTNEISNHVVHLKSLLGERI